MDRYNSIPEDLKLGYVITILFMMILILFIILIIVIYNKRKVAHLKATELKHSEYQNRILRERLDRHIALQNERERFSSDLHDEIGAGISAIKLRIEFIKKINQEKNIDAELDELLWASGALNSSMREMLWNLNNDNADIQQLYNFIVNYGTTFFKKTNISFTSDYLIEQGESFISFSQRKNIVSCVKELFNNAYKHSHATTVKAAFLKDIDKFTICITDNGIGFRSINREGHGLNNIQKRMHQINGLCTVISKANPTVIELNFPFER